MKTVRNVKMLTRILVSLAVAIFVFLTSFKDVFHRADDYLCDRLYQSEGVSYLPVTIVEIDEKSMESERLGQFYGWSRQVYADLVNTLSTDEYSPAVIAFDIQFSGHKYDAEGNIDKGDIAFAEAAKRSGNVVAASKIQYVESIDGVGESARLNTGYINTVEYPYDELKEVVSCGFVNEQAESDGYVRTVLTVEKYNDEWMDCLALASLRKFVDHYNVDKKFRESWPQLADINIDDYSQYDIRKYRFSYTSGANSDAIGTHVSLIDILDGTIPANSFDNGIVIVGAHDTGLGDIFKVPLAAEYSEDANLDNSMYGVEIHANIMHALAEGLLQTDPVGFEKFLVSFLFAVAAGLFCFFMFRLRLRIGAVVGIALFAAVVLSGKICYSNGLYVYIFVPLLTLILIYIGYIIFYYSVTKLEKSKINKAFKMYVAPEIVDEMAADGNFQLHLGGRNKDIAVLFVDIRGFTTMSESLKPEEVVEVLNEYFSIVTDAIFKNKGTLDKFIGDAAMAVFNSPYDLDDYVYRAVHAAVDIAAGSDSIRNKFLERFGKTVNYGIGVNCGEATIGNIGSPFRMDYTAIGDTVNTASRLESNAPAGTILISDEVKNRLGDRIQTEPVGEIPLKGKTVGIMVHKVIALNE